MNIRSLILTVALTATAYPALAEKPTYQNEDAQLEQRVEDALKRMTLEEKVALCHAQSKFSSAGVPRLGIPELWMSDGPHGVRMEINWNDWGHSNWTNDSVTAFPALTALAATWNPEMSALYGKSLGEEARYREKDVMLGPGVNIYRTPINGRNFEYMGEDPFLAGEMVVPYIQEMQKNGVAACVKHYALNNQEKWRGTVDVEVSDRALYEIYLPAFKKAVEDGKVWSIMGSYNRYQGQHACHNKRLLQDILRDEWGFDGVIVSDWGSISDMIPAGVAADRKEATLLAAAAGVDIDMEGLCYPAHLEEWVKEGKISEETIDGMVRNVLRLKFRLGLFENPYTEIENRPVMYAPEHLETARRLAEEGTVLLKNDGILPLGKKPGKILVTGPLADAPHDQCGTWAPDREKSRSVTPLAALRRMYGREAVIYSPGVRYSRDNSGDGISAAVEAARDADVVLCFLGEEAVLSGEAHCLASLDLKGRQRELVERLHAVGKPTVAVFMAGRPLTVGREIELSDAALYSFHGGTMAGPALANILSGDVNPSGKLPVTMARLTGQYPMYHAHKNTGRPPFWSVDIDDIPVEAEQTSTGCTSYHLDAGVEPLYPFGYGLSYTEFEFGTPTLSAQTVSKSSAVPLKVSCTVKNTGNRRGEETVQLYIRDKVASLARPVKELRDFVKISLEPGEARQIEMELSPDRLAFHGLDGSEIIEPGEFEVWMAPDSSSGEPVTFTLTD